MKLFSVLSVVLVFCILTNSRLSLSYAAAGLELWLQKMVPTLLPFSILSGVMVRMRLTEKVAMLVYPLLHPFFRVRKNVCYAMLMGFLCGFPMGARVVGELYGEGLITIREAEYLLAFCNNIGPVYFCGFVLPLLGRQLLLPYLFGMYGIPLLYGLLLRYTAFRDIGEQPACQQLAGKQPGKRQPAHKKSGSGQLVCCEQEAEGFQEAFSFLEALDDSIAEAGRGILMLGGYMVLFNLLNLLPHLLLGRSSVLFAPLLEISGGLNGLQQSFPLYSLLAVSFGGLSCIAQTYSCIRETGLSIAVYIRRKLLQTLLTGGFYGCWFLASGFLHCSFLA